MEGDQRHIHDPAKAEEFARALGLQIGGAGHPFAGPWATKGLCAYISGKYSGMAFFGTGGSERDRLTIPHESDKYRPWNRYDPDIPDHIRKKLIQLEDDDSTSFGQPHRARRGNSEIRDEEEIRLFKKTLDEHGVPSDFLARTQTSRGQPARTEPSHNQPARTQPSVETPSINIDERKIAIKSVHGKYLSAQPDGRAEWNRDIANEWEYFNLEKRQGGKITLRGAHGMYVSAQPDGEVQINRQAAPPTGWEEFTVENRGNNVVCLKSCHGKYLSAQPDGTAQWNRDHAPRGGWEDIQFVQQGGTGQVFDAASRIQQHTNTGGSSASTSIEPIQILEAVSGKPVRFKINNLPNHNDAWVGIYNPNAHDQDHGAQNNRWKWLRDIDVDNASFPKQAVGSHSIRVFSDGGYRLHERKDFQVRAQTVATQTLDETAEKPERRRIGFAALFGLFLILPGLPLLIIGSTSTAEDRLAMIIPGAILMSVGGFALLVSISTVIRMGSRKGRSSVMRTEAGGSASTNIEVLSFNHNQPIRFKINNPPLGNSSWVGIYPVDAGDRDHEDRWQWLRDIEVDNATLPGQTKGQWSIRVFSDAGYTLHKRVDFEILEGYKDEVWMKNARIEDSRIKGDMIDHPTFGNMNRRTSRIIQRARHGNVHRIETNNTTYLIYDEDLQEEMKGNEAFWET